MTTCTRRAFPAWAMPALVALLAAAPMSAGASEGGDAATFAAPVAVASAVAPAPSPIAPLAPLAADRAAPQPEAVMAVFAPPPPRPLPGGHGPVRTDAYGMWWQEGIASWYGGRRWQGRPTASGVRFDDRLLTAAHASLPLGSRVRVTVADTGQSVVVTINDRPGTRKRVIDLSRAAAAELGILRRGLAPVRLDPA